MAKPYTRSTVLPIYDVGFHLVLSDSEADACPVLRRLLGASIDPKDPYSCAFFPGEKDFAISLIRGRIEPGDIAHETYHLAHHVLNRAGIFSLKKNQEPFAYLQGYVVNCIYKWLGVVTHK